MGSSLKDCSIVHRSWKRRGPKLVGSYTGYLSVLNMFRCWRAQGLCILLLDMVRKISKSGRAMDYQYSRRWIRRDGLRKKLGNMRECRFTMQIQSSLRICEGRICSGKREQYSIPIRTVGDV